MVFGWCLTRARGGIAHYGTAIPGACRLLPALSVKLNYIALYHRQPSG